MVIAPGLFGCLLGYSREWRGHAEERKRLAAALAREATDPVARTDVEKLFRRHLPLTGLSRGLSTAAGLDGGRERDPVPPATRLAGRPPGEPPPPR